MKSFIALALLNIFSSSIFAANLAEEKFIECGDHWLSVNVEITSASEAKLSVSGDSGVEIYGVARFSIVKTADSKEFFSLTLDDQENWVHLEIDITDSKTFAPAELQLDHTGSIQAKSCHFY